MHSPSNVMHILRACMDQVLVDNITNKHIIEERLPWKTVSFGLDELTGILDILNKHSQSTSMYVRVVCALTFSCPDSHQTFEQYLPYVNELILYNFKQPGSQ